MKQRMITGLLLSILLGLLITGCNPAAGGSSDAGATDEPSNNSNFGGETELNIYNWSTYIAPEIIPAFQEKYGVTVNYDIFADNEELLAKIQPGNPGYDIIVPSDYMVEIMIAEGLLEELDHSKIPNMSNIDPVFVDPPFDPGNTYCVPYQGGTMGLGYDSSKTAEIDSWSAIFDGSNAGRISLLTEARSVIAAALLYLGYDPNTTNPAEIEEAVQILKDVKGDIVAFAPDTGQILLEQGEVDVAFEYSGDIFQLMQSDPDVRYVIPKEGSIVWTDNMCIPENAPHPELAHAFINFILEAEIGAQLSNYTQYQSPNKASFPMLDEELLSTYPTEEDGERLHFIRSLGEADLLYEEAWTELGVAE